MLYQQIPAEDVAAQLVVRQSVLCNNNNNDVVLSSVLQVAPVFLYFMYTSLFKKNVCLDFFSYSI